jgi:hypothetical protein
MFRLLSRFKQMICTLPVDMEERPELDGQAQWVAFQAYFRDLEDKAKEEHGRVNDVRARRMSLVHSALGLAAKRSIPTERGAS